MNAPVQARQFAHSRNNITTPFSLAWPLDILHFEKLDAVQCFSICAHLSPARDSACEQSDGCPKLAGDAPKNTCHPGFVENCHLSKFPRVRAVMVVSGKCGRVGNGSGRERESRVYFVPDRDFPTPSRPRSLFPPSTVPTYSILFPS